MYKPSSHGDWVPEPVKGHREESGHDGNTGAPDPVSCSLRGEFVQEFVHACSKPQWRQSAGPCYAVRRSSALRRVTSQAAQLFPECKYPSS